MIKKFVFAAALASVAASAQAATVSGTFAAALAGVSSSTPGIGAGSVLSNVGGFVTSTTGDMSAVPMMTPVNFSTVTALNGSAVSFTSSFGAFVGTLQGLMTQAAPNAVVSFTSLGNFTPGGALDSFMSGPALLTVSFTQTGLIGAGRPPAISGSFSFDSEAGGGSGGAVPEPASWAMLIAGFGLTGAAMRRRVLRTVAA